MAGERRGLSNEWAGPFQITEGNIRIFLKLKVEYTTKEGVSNVDVRVLVTFKIDKTAESL